MSFLIDKLIMKEGTPVTIRVRTETVDSEGHVQYTFDSTIETTAVIQTLTGFRETWYEVALADESDYFGLIKGAVSINKGDRILLVGLELEVREVVERNPHSTKFKEIVLDKI